MLTLITIAQLLVFFTYVGFIYNRYGVLQSISHSTYKLEGESRWWFLAFLWILGILNLIQGMEVYGFLTTAGLLFTGITIDHKSSGAHTDIVHYVGASVAILSALIGLVVLHGMWLAPILVLASIPFIWNREDFIWWIEIVAMIVIIGGYLMR